MLDENRISELTADVIVHGVMYERQLLRIPCKMVIALEYNDFSRLTDEEKERLDEFLKDYSEEGWEFKATRSDLSNYESFSDFDDVYGCLSICEYCEFWRKSPLNNAQERVKEAIEIYKKKGFFDAKEDEHYIQTLYEAEYTIKKRDDVVFVIELEGK